MTMFSVAKAQVIERVSITGRNTIGLTGEAGVEPRTYMLGTMDGREIKLWPGGCNGQGQLRVMLTDENGQNVRSYTVSNPSRSACEIIESKLYTAVAYGLILTTTGGQTTMRIQGDFIHY